MKASYKIKERERKKTEGEKGLGKIRTSFNFNWERVF